MDALYAHPKSVSTRWGEKNNPIAKYFPIVAALTGGAIVPIETVSGFIWRLFPFCFVFEGMIMGDAPKPAP